MEQPSRRSVLKSGLSVAVGAVLSGCGKLSKPDVKVSNYSSQDLTYSLEIRQLTPSEVTLSKTRSIPQDESHDYNECVSEQNGAHRIDIQVENGPSATREWSREDEGTMLGIDITPTEVTFGVFRR